MQWIERSIVRDGIAGRVKWQALLALGVLPSAARASRRRTLRAQPIEDDAAVRIPFPKGFSCLNTATMNSDGDSGYAATREFMNSRNALRPRALVATGSL